MGLQTLESVRRTTLRLRTTGDSDRMESGYQMVRDHILTWEARRKALEAFAVERSDEAPTTLAAIKKRGKAAVRAEQLQKRRKFHNAGWPKSWSLRRIEDWRSHGRGIAQAQEFARAGWRAKDGEGPATGHGDVQDPAPASSRADECCALGNTLLGLIRGDWPSPPQTLEESACGAALDVLR